MTRQRLAFGLKLVAAHVLFYSGILPLWQRIAMRRKAVVLMYHRVLTRDEQRRTASHPALVVDRDTFARQMAFLKRRFNVISAHELADRMARGIPLPDRACVITFDDGWRDNFTNALPILRAHRLPALIFLPVNYIGRQRLFWQEALTHLLERAVAEVHREPAARPRLDAILGPRGLSHVLDADRDDPRAAVLQAVGAQKPLTRVETEALVETLARELGIRMETLAEIDGFIGWTEVQAMAREGISFGGHGVDHLLLTQVSGEEADTEIRVSKQVIEERLQEPVLTFSYPNGYLTPEIAGKVKKFGYRLGFITRRGFVSTSDDPFTVRRLNVHEAAAKTTPMFLARVVGLW
jgi:peptidoglycan/xylan/chitin deacetylase (PgdA/CDA1 family)